MLGALLAAFAALGSPPLQVAADHLEAHADARWQATGDVRLTVGEWTVAAESASGTPDAACPTGRTTLGAPRLRGVHGEADADRATVCGDLVEVHRLSLRGPRLRLTAEDATLTRGARFEGTGIVASPCGCADPPWTVSAGRAHGDASTGAWLSWPVLRAGAVPVAAAPAWYVPFARRRSGLLLPRVGWDGEDGFHGELPVFWAFHQSADLTLSPGWRMSRGPSLGGRLRWASAPDESGTVRTRSVLDGDTPRAVFAGDGAATLGGFTLSLSGDVPTDVVALDVLGHGIAERGRDHTRGQAALTAGRADIQIGARAVGLADLRAARATGAAALWGPPENAMPLPEGWLTWRGDLSGTGSIGVDARWARLAGADQTWQRLELGADADAVRWVGPLRARLAGGVHTAILDAGEDGNPAAQRLDGFVGGSAEIAVARRFSAVGHQIGLILEGRVADAGVVQGAPPAFEVVDRPLPSRRVGVTLRQRLLAPTWQARLDLEGGYEARSPVQGAEVPRLRAVVDGRWLGLEGLADAAQSVWGRLRVGRVDGSRVRLGASRLRLAPETPWLRTAGLRTPRALVADTGDLATVLPGGSLALGRFVLDYDAVLDAEAGELLGQDGALQHRGRCDCWSAGLRVSHQRGRDLPDLWATLDLGW
jgi:hypothetical protein